MSIIKRRPGEDPPEPPSAPAPPSNRGGGLIKGGGPPPDSPFPSFDKPRQSSIIKGGTVIREAPPEPETKPEPQSSGGVVVVGDPDAPKAAPPPPSPSPVDAPKPVAVQTVDKEIIEKAQAKAAQIVEDAMNKVQALKSKVEQEMQARLEEMNRQCQEAFLKAKDDGFSRGMEEGKVAAQQEFVALMNEARKVLSQALQGREMLIRSSSGEIARLGLRVAEKIIGQEIQVNEEVVVSIVKQALEKIKDREQVTVRVNPSDVEYVRMNRSMFERMVEGLKSFEITSDAKVERGGCILLTNLGSVDARISTQLQVISLAFTEIERQEKQEMMDDLARSEAANNLEASPEPPAEEPHE